MISTTLFIFFLEYIICNYIYNYIYIFFFFEYITIFLFRKCIRFFFLIYIKVLWGFFKKLIKYISYIHFFYSNFFFCWTNACNKKINDLFSNLFYIYIYILYNINKRFFLLQILFVFFLSEKKIVCTMVYSNFYLFFLIKYK